MHQTISLAELLSVEEKEDRELLPILKKENMAAGGPWGILNWSRIRRSPSRYLEEVSPLYCRQIKCWMEKREPIQLVLIAFPFKIKNREKTNRVFPDAGEFWFISQLRRISLLVKSVYEPGARFTVLTESETFADLFEVSQEEWGNYLGGVRGFAEFLDAPVEFRSMRQLVDKTPNFWEVFAEELERFRRTPPDSSHHLWNIFLSSQNGNSSDEKTAHMLGWYLAFNEVRYKLGVPAGVFPGHLYISVTVKKDRFAFWHIQEGCSLLPHHGVPLLKQGRKKRIVHLRELPSDAVPVYLKESDPQSDKPFLYLL